MSGRAELRRQAREDARTAGTRERPATESGIEPVAADALHGFSPRTWLFVLGLLLVVAFTYAPVRNAGFIWDDEDYVEHNDLLVEPHGLAEIWNPESPRNPQYYPLVFTTFRIERSLWGLDPTGYHVVNVALHFLDALLLYLLLRRVGIGWAWLPALVFAAHPVNVESVAWVAERKNVLSAFFYFLAAHAYLTFQRGDDPTGEAPRWGIYVLSMLCFVLALFAKTVTASLPIALALLLWWRNGKVSRRTIGTLAPMLVIGFAMGMLTRAHEYKHVFSGTAGLPDKAVWERLLTAGRAFWFYPTKVLFPNALAFIYGRWDVRADVLGQWLFPLAGVALALGLLALLRRRMLARGALAAVLFYAATIFPALGFVDVAPLRFSPVADHFQYLASIGTILLACAGLSALAQRASEPAAPRVMGILGILWIAALALVAQRQTRVYENLGTLWADTVEKSPENPMVLNSYANWLRKQHDPDPEKEARLRDEAARYSELALHHAPPQSEDALYAHCNLSSTRLSQHRYQEAIDEADAALAVNVDSAAALGQKGRALYDMGRYPEAEAALTRMLGIRYDPADGRAAWDLRRRVDDTPAHLLLGLLRSRGGRHEEALESYVNVLALDPANPLANRGRIDSLAALERWPELVKALEEAARNVQVPLPFRQQLAWYLAVAPDPNVRDGARALAMTRELGGALPDASPLAASVHGAALAETGDTAGALAVVKAALERARASGATGLVPQLEAQVADYAAGRPTRVGKRGK